MSKVLDLSVGINISEMKMHEKDSNFLSKIIEGTNYDITCIFDKKNKTYNTFIQSRSTIKIH